MLDGTVARRTIRLDAPLDLRLTLAPLWRGRGDPTLRIGPDGVWRATRTPDGTATIHLVVRWPDLVAEAWGLGAAWALEHSPAMAGLLDDPAGLRTDHPVIRDLARRNPGLRFPRTLAVMESLVPAIIEQKVTGNEAHRAWRGLVAVHGEPAPGPPGDAGMRVPTAPSATPLSATVSSSVGKRPKYISWVASRHIRVCASSDDVRCWMRI